jgi:hypothetical protein
MITSSSTKPSPLADSNMAYRINKEIKPLLQVTEAQDTFPVWCSLYYNSSDFIAVRRNLLFINTVQ